MFVFTVFPCSFWATSYPRREWRWRSNTSAQSGHGPSPTPWKQSSKFLGFDNYFQRFNRGFSTVVTPLTSLLRGPQHLCWTAEAARTLETLKARFTTILVLVHSNPSLPFIVEVNASEGGVGAVLSQCTGTPPKPNQGLEYILRFYNLSRHSYPEWLTGARRDKIFHPIGSGIWTSNLVFTCTMLLIAKLQTSYVLNIIGHNAPMKTLISYILRTWQPCSVYVWHDVDEIFS